MKSLIAAAALSILSFIPANAQGLRVTDYSATLGTSAVNCAPLDAGRRTLFIENPAGGSNNIGYCADDSGTCVPVIGAAGTSVLVPGVIDNWPLGTAAKSVNCIASGASTPVTIRSGK